MFDSKIVIRENGDLQQLSLQVWWAKVKDFGLLHVLKRVELWFLLFFVLNFKFKPKIELVAIGLQNSTSSSLGLSLKIVGLKRDQPWNILLRHLRHM